MDELRISKSHWGSTRRRTSTISELRVWPSAPEQPLAMYGSRMSVETEIALSCRAARADGKPIREASHNEVSTPNSSTWPKMNKCCTYTRNTIPWVNVLIMKCKMRTELESNSPYRILRSSFGLNGAKQVGGEVVTILPVMQSRGQNALKEVTNLTSLRK